MFVTEFSIKPIKVLFAQLFSKVFITVEYVFNFSIVESYNSIVFSIHSWHYDYINIYIFICLFIYAIEVVLNLLFIY